MIVDLAPEEGADLSLDSVPAVAVFRTTGRHPTFTLAAADGAEFALSPGRYEFSFEVRVLQGVLGRPAVICLNQDGRISSFPLEIVDPLCWRASVTVDHTVSRLKLTLDGGRCVFLPVRLSIDDGWQRRDASPSVREGALMVARALFRRAPHWLRAAIINRRGSLTRSSREKEENSEGAGRIILRHDVHSDKFMALREDCEQRFAVAQGAKSSSYVERGGELKSASPPALITAFYLPQFHAIPENDEWWGRGFTEWTNVAKAQPQFVGHYQPRLPGEFGFYDLLTPGLLARQAQLARAYGVGAFCFHYYWFKGKRLLEAPVEGFLADRSIDISFTLCWANENWSRTWDGAPDRVLISQQHSREDHAAVFDDLARHLEDPRALSIEGKPLLLLYRPELIPDVRAMTDLWRERALKRGWRGIHLTAVNAFGYDAWEGDGFDALCEFPPHGIVGDRIEHRLSWLNDRHKGAVFDYGSVARREARRLARVRSSGGKTFPGVMPGWDNEARRPGAGTVFHGSNPEDYAQWLKAAVDFAVRELAPDRRIVFVNAWNEWAEGAYLEPDRRFGRAYLAATAQVLDAAGDAVGSPVAIEGDCA